MRKYNLFVPVRGEVKRCYAVDSLRGREKMVEIEIKDNFFPILCRADKRILCNDYEEAKRAAFILALGGTYNGVEG